MWTLGICTDTWYSVKSVKWLWYHHSCLWIRALWLVSVMPQLFVDQSFVTGIWHHSCLWIRALWLVSDTTAVWWIRALSLVSVIPQLFGGSELCHWYLWYHSCLVDQSFVTGICDTTVVWWIRALSLVSVTPQLFGGSELCHWYLTPQLFGESELCHWYLWHHSCLID